MLEDNDLMAPYKLMLIWNQYRKELVNVQILVMMNDYITIHHLFHDLMLDLKLNKLIK